ncbi:mRNA surveillance protein pelota [Candidatus Woesearchaeota archaeon]|nr:mRNA surveillance protein pelota [Candidatus Woesearchaeota archaeon]
MKQIQMDLKKKQAKLKIENQDDLWYLSYIIDIGDIVKGKTIRKIKIGSEGDRKQSIVKKPVFLKIRIEKIEFSRQAGTLRVLGIITEGPDDVQKGEHHTFSLEPNTIFTLIKEKWLKYQLDRLKEACKEKKSRIIIIVMDREEASFALLKKYGYDVLTEIKGKVRKKAVEEESGGKFYQEIIKKAEEYVKRYGAVKVILASPAFWKEELMKELDNGELKKIIIAATCNSTGKNGIDEVLKRPEVKAALQEDRIAGEISLVEELLSEISKNNLAAYGLKDTENAANAGAVRALLVTDSLIQKARDNNSYERIDNIMKAADSMKGSVHIISSEHEGGKKLNGLGGIGAILRYRLDYPGS